MRAFAERKEVKLGAVAQPLRAALTGRPTSPGIFDVLQVLGKQESLARLADQTRHAALSQGGLRAWFFGRILAAWRQGSDLITGMAVSCSACSTCASKSVGSW